MNSDVDTYEAKFNVVILNEGAADSENIQGSCTINIPKENGHNQLMFQNWFPLQDASGNPSKGKIRLGIQYIYDQVKLFDTLAQLKEEDLKNLTDELQRTEDILEKTSCIYLVSIYIIIFRSF